MCLFKNSVVQLVGGLDKRAKGGGTRSGRALCRRGLSGQDRESKSIVTRAKRQCSQSGRRGGMISEYKKQASQRA